MIYLEGFILRLLITDNEAATFQRLLREFYNNRLKENVKEERLSQKIKYKTNHKRINLTWSRFT